MSLTIVYNTEYTRSSDHGLAVLWYNIVFLAGNLFGIAVSFVTLNKYGWRVYIIYTTVPCIALSIPMFLLKESIRYLQVKGKTKDIIKILKTITRTVKKSWPENVQLKTEVSSIYGRNISNSPVISKHWKSLLGLSVYGVPLYITYYGLPFLINFKLQHKNSCQIPQTLTLCTPLTDGEIMQSFFVNLGLLPGSILGYLLAEKVGRKTLLGFSAVLMAITYFSLLICRFPVVVTYFLLFLCSGLSLSTACFLFLYSAELFPTNSRGTVTGIAACIWKTSSILSPVLFQQLIYTHYHWVLISLGTSSLVGLFALFILPETLKKKLED